MQRTHIHNNLNIINLWKLNVGYLTEISEPEDEQLSMPEKPCFMEQELNALVRTILYEDKLENAIQFTERSSNDAI